MRLRYIFLSLAVFCLSFAASRVFSQDQNESHKVHFSEVDLDGDDLITPDEMSRWRMAKFGSRDINQDGILIRDELMQPARDGARAFSWEESTVFLTTFDADRDMEISYQEVADAIEASNFFSIIDFNGSGTITRYEAEGWLDVTPRQAGGTPETPH